MIENGRFDLNRDDLKKFIGDLGSYYGFEKFVDSKRMDQWLEKTKDIPTESLPFIFGRITDERDTIPRNIPKNMRDFYHQWQSSSGKVMDYPRTDCHECHGEGILWARRPALIDGKLFEGVDGPVTEEVAYRCQLCENWKRHCYWKAMKPATRFELENQGMTVWVRGEGWENGAFMPKERSDRSQAAPF